MDQLRALKYFISVAESGSFTLSAAQFSVPASSLSRRIADLEKLLGATLLQRTTRVVQLTEVGRDYYHQVKPIVGELAQSDASVRSYHSEPMGTLRISSMVSFGERWLIPILDDFSLHYPKIVLDVHLTDSLTTLERDNIDIAIRGGYAPNERIVATKLLDNNFIPLASRAYLEQYGTPDNALALKRHRGLYFRAPNGPTPWLAKIGEQWQDVSAPAVMTTNDRDWLMRKAVNGEGIIFLPRWAAQDYLSDERLLPLSFTEPVNVTPQRDFALYLLYQRHRYSVPKIRAAVEFIQREVDKRVGG
ncbi:LysR family transcriptional regulator [Thaumasiovibrio sp. DFM-14]|uniref:LysR family transcriptional regulator n=1 Tax=Thaumasiovibrio sp. DFM-14 TaxID=3384792 RepID=UPI0039A17138